MRIWLGVLIALIAAQAHAKSAVFFHPDGMGLNSWQAMRYATVGAQGALNYDKLEHIGLYIGSMSDRAAATSNGGATTHAYGIKAQAGSYGMIDGKPITAASGFDGSLIHEAVAKGLKTALINSGNIIEPGTGVYASRVNKREDYDSIAQQVLSSGVDVILSGGEQHMLPKGTKGVHGEGLRADNLNLIKEAQKNGYVVVYNATELKQAVAKNPKKLLGVFAANHTFYDFPPLILKAKGLPEYLASAPTIAQMIEATLKLFEGEEFLIVAEEEATDNFSNVGNPKAALNAAKRADDAYGVLNAAHQANPDILVITTSDSDAGGIQLEAVDDLKDADYRYPSANGKQLGMKLVTVGTGDYAGGILARSTHPLPSVVDNTQIYRLVHRHLFGK